MTPDIILHLITMIAVVINTSINVILYRDRKKKYEQSD